jgi:predicted DNA-binding ribbon-helix-helix protein
LKKRSVKIAGHVTSITLEEPFWQELKTLAKKEGLSLNALITKIDKTRSGNLSSALRVYILNTLKK